MIFTSGGDLDRVCGVSRAGLAATATGRTTGLTSRSSRLMIESMLKLFERAAAAGRGGDAVAVDVSGRPKGEAGE